MFVTHPFEGVNICSFMSSCETAFIAFSISRNMFFVSQTKIFDRFPYYIVASIISHRLSTVYIYTYNGKYKQKIKYMKGDMH